MDNITIAGQKRNDTLLQIEISTKMETEIIKKNVL